MKIFISKQIQKFNRTVARIAQLARAKHATYAYRHACQRSHHLYQQHKALGQELLTALKIERAAGERMEQILDVASEVTL